MLSTSHSALRSLKKGLSVIVQHMCVERGQRGCYRASSSVQSWQQRQRRGQCRQRQPWQRCSAAAPGSAAQAALSTPQIDVNGVKRQVRIPCQLLEGSARGPPAPPVFVRSWLSLLRIHHTTDPEELAPALPVLMGVFQTDACRTRRTIGLISPTCRARQVLKIDTGDGKRCLESYTRQGRSIATFFGEANDGHVARAEQVEDGQRRVNEALHVSNMPALQSQLAAATAATATEDLWDDPQVRQYLAQGCWQSRGCLMFI